ncbi:hypothetical protein R75461_07699 [Paraburkholderia nemoris]|jgi:hypothetical protein|uniref:DUF3304 domain-containing protein n=1 Tax=Paraburkholderia nemoris TaxID=2793076 RepID=UPI00190BAD7B|nr:MULTISPECIES: DUF3304 domain-containing protein [Paraburkholderia]MBK3786458.1 DUF3304 domain-containing protein [Paraburkholderia aspalathi]CAE6855718.1 hypothetical protein R75461_07699 [Paraburkholderia nemoris]
MNHRSTMTKFVQWLAPLALVLLLFSACSRAADSPAPQTEDDTMGLKLVGLNYTEIPIGDFYTDGTWGAAIPSRIGSWSGTIICCVSLPKKWHPGLTVAVQWQDDNLYKKNPNALASRVVPVEKYEYFSDGFLYVLFFPNDKIKVYASPWAPGYPDFPEGLQEPGASCPGHFTLKNSDPRCPAPDKRIKP